VLWMQTYDPACINKEIFEAYSAKEVTRRLADLLEQALKSGNE
jgi:hypothetical protein